MYTELLTWTTVSLIIIRVRTRQIIQRDRRRVQSASICADVVAVSRALRLCHPLTVSLAGAEIGVGGQDRPRLDDLIRDIQVFTCGIS
jgi:hypothetical protein